MHRQSSYIAQSFLISLLFLSLTGCSQRDPVLTGTPSVPPESENPTVSSQPATPTASAHTSENEESDAYEQELSYFYGLETPESLEERFSYAYGYILMESALRDLPSLNASYFLRGIYDKGIDGSQMLTQEERITAFNEFQTKLVNEASQELEALAEKNLKEAEDFLQVNADAEGVMTTDSGLQYRVLSGSDATRPKDGDSVKVNYTLTFLDGREGDSSIPGIPSTFSLNNLIPGFREGLKLMGEGSSYRFYVHPELGYGTSGNSRIEPNTLLIFDVELVEVLTGE